MQRRCDLHRCDDPFEPGRIAIQFVQRRHVAIERIEIANDGLDPLVPWLIEKMPVKCVIVVPFAFLAELRSP